MKYSIRRGWAESTHKTPLLQTVGRFFVNLPTVSFLPNLKVLTRNLCSCFRVGMLYNRDYDGSLAFMLLIYDVLLIIRKWGRDVLFRLC